MKKLVLLFSLIISTVCLGSSEDEMKQKLLIYAQKLDSGTPYEVTIIEPNFGIKVIKRVIGVKDGKYLIEDELVDGSKMLGALSLKTKNDLVNYFTKYASCENHEIIIKSGVSIEKMDGVIVYNPLALAFKNGEIKLRYPK